MSALIVGPDERLRGETLELLRRRGADAVTAERLTRDDLERASVVALLGAADAATPQEPLRAHALPAEAAEVLAARRILVAPRAATTFGLLPGTDHLAASTPDDVAAYVHMTLAFPEAFEPFRVFGALAARSAPRSAAPRG